MRIMKFFLLVLISLSSFMFVATGCKFAKPQETALKEDEEGNGALPAAEVSAELKPEWCRPVDVIRGLGPATMRVSCAPAQVDPNQAKMGGQGYIRNEEQPLAVKLLVSLSETKEVREIPWQDGNQALKIGVRELYGMTPTNLNPLMAEVLRKEQVNLANVSAIKAKEFLLKGGTLLYGTSGAQDVSYRIGGLPPTTVGAGDGRPVIVGVKKLGPNLYKYESGSLTFDLAVENGVEDYMRKFGVYFDSGILYPSKSGNLDFTQDGTTAKVELKVAINAPDILEVWGANKGDVATVIWATLNKGVDTGPLSGQ